MYVNHLAMINNDMFKVHFVPHWLSPVTPMCFVLIRSSPVFIQTCFCVRRPHLLVCVCVLVYNWMVNVWWLTGYLAVDMAVVVAPHSAGPER